MFSVISDAMPGGLEQEELSKKVKEAAMSRLYDVKRDSKDRKIIHEYGVKWFVTASRESPPIQRSLRCYKAANDPAYGADDAVDGERSGEGSGNPG